MDEHCMLDFLDEIGRVYESNENDRAKLLQDILSRASAACGTSDTADLHLLRGYAAYHFPELIQDSVDIERELNAVLSERPDDLTARFYLACHLFDIGNFRNAYEHLALLNCSEFRDAAQIWREIKVDELRLCCEAALEMYDSFVSGFSQLVDKIVATDSENIPSPTELVHCFETCGKRLFEVLGIETYRECSSLLQTYVSHADDRFV